MCRSDGELYQRRPVLPPSCSSRLTRFRNASVTAWRELVGRSIVNVDIEPLEAGRLRAEATACLLPGLGLIFAYSDAHRCNHPRELIKNDDLSFMAVSAPR